MVSVVYGIGEIGGWIAERALVFAPASLAVAWSRVRYLALMAVLTRRRSTPPPADVSMASLVMVAYDEAHCIRAARA